MGKYFPDTVRHAKAQEFLELKQGTMTVMDYVDRFTELTRFANDYVATDMAKVRRFENGLKLSIRGRIVGLRLQDMDSMVGITLTIEREIEDAQSTQDTGVSSKRKESQSSSNSGKKQRSSSSRGFQDRSHPGQGRIRVSSQARQMACYHYQKPGHIRCHAPIPGPTRLANPNRFRGAKPYTWTLYFFFFFRAELVPVSIQTIYVITKIIYIHKRTTIGVVSIKIYTHILSPIYLYKCLYMYISNTNIRDRGKVLVSTYL